MESTLQSISWQINSFASFPKKNISLLSFKGTSIDCNVKFWQISVNTGLSLLNISISFSKSLVVTTSPKEYADFGSAKKLAYTY